MLWRIDLFATPARVTASRFGGAASVCAVLGCTAYLTVLLVQSLTMPPVKSISTEWTLGQPPFPITITCDIGSPQPCFIENILTDVNTMGISRLVPIKELNRNQTVQQGESIEMHIVFTMTPRDEGICVHGGNISVQSQIRCAQDAPGCVVLLELPLTLGLIGDMNLVETTNKTAKGPARFRREWFMNTVPAAHTHMACLRLHALYNKVDVMHSQDAIVGVIGQAGGAMGIIMKAVGVIVGLWHKFRPHHDPEQVLQMNRNPIYG